MSEDTRQPTRFATYPGNVTTAIERDKAEGKPFGPTLLHETWWPVTAVYNPDVDATRVGFSLIPPAIWSPA